MIKDKKGNELHFGDEIKDGIHRQTIRFAYEWYENKCGEPKTYALCVSQSGGCIKIQSDNGVLTDYTRIVDAALLRFAPNAQWVPGRLPDGREVVVCTCCGSPLPTATQVDEIPQEDNHYCYFCGAKTIPY